MAKISKAQYEHLVRLTSGEFTHYSQEFLGGFRTPIYGVLPNGEILPENTATVVTIDALEKKGLLENKQHTEIGRWRNFIGSHSTLTDAGRQAIADYESKK
jgi:hypothetical protein